jgi:hypothetical protein
VGDPYEKGKLQGPRFGGEALDKKRIERERQSRFRRTDRGRLPRSNPGTCARHVAASARGDSGSRAGGGDRGDQLWHPGFQIQRNAGMVCSIFGPLQLLSDCKSDGRVKDELKSYKTSKGTIQFPLDNPLPAALVKKMVKMRLAEKQRG